MHFFGAFCKMGFFGTFFSKKNQKKKFSQGFDTVFDTFLRFYKNGQKVDLGGGEA